MSVILTSHWTTILSAPILLQSLPPPLPLTLPLPTFNYSRHIGFLCSTDCFYILKCIQNYKILCTVAIFLSINYIYTHIRLTYPKNGQLRHGAHTQTHTHTPCTHTNALLSLSLWIPSRKQIGLPNASIWWSSKQWDHYFNFRA